MIRLFIFQVVSVSMLSGILVHGQEPRLSYALVPGQEYNLDIEIRQSTSSESVEREDIQLFSRCHIRFSVDSVNPGEEIHFSVRYNDLMLSMLAPGMGVDLNSESGSSPMLASMLDSLEEVEFSAGFRPTGELTYLHGLDEAFVRFSSPVVRDTMLHHVVLSTMKELYGQDAFRSLAGLFLWVYPAIQPMKNWTNDILYYFNTKPVKIVNRYYLIRSDEKEVTIQGLGLLSGTQPFLERTNMGKVSSRVSGSQTYDFQMDRNSGWPVRCISRQRLSIETTILESNYLPEGLKIPSFTETEFEIRGVQR